MSISNEKILRLTFATAGGGTFVITIPNPKEELTSDPANAVAMMEALVQDDIVLASTGALTGIRDIKIIDTTTNDLYDAP